MGDKSLGVNKVGTHFGRIIDPESGTKVVVLCLPVVGCLCLPVVCYLYLYLYLYLYFFIFIFIYVGTGGMDGRSGGTGRDEQA